MENSYHVDCMGYAWDSVAILTEQRDCNRNGVEPDLFEKQIVFATRSVSGQMPFHTFPVVHQFWPPFGQRNEIQNDNEFRAEPNQWLFSSIS